MATPSGTQGDSSSSVSSTNHSQSSRRDDLPPELMDIIKPALQFGGLSGMFISCMSPRLPFVDTHHVHLHIPFLFTKHLSPGNNNTNNTPSSFRHHYRWIFRNPRLSNPHSLRRRQFHPMGHPWHHLLGNSYSTAFTL